LGALALLVALPLGGLTSTLISLGGALLLIALFASTPSGPRARHPEAALGVVAASGVFLVAFVGRDLSWVTTARPQGYERLIHLFVYNYGRIWPEHLDYRPILTGFALVAAGLLAASVSRALRPIAARALLGFALLFAAWTLDIYLVDLSPHWGQRDLIARYYEVRGGADEPLIAWQMNWKGENFYTGNRAHVFADVDNVKVREWIGENAGRRVFFVTEHGRATSLQRLLGDRPIEEITDMRLCNKFILIRVTL
ncbi:MAG: hypothetical protein OEY14_14135, partial [Myxococcales bacterium]|nr:hypothetical protein [Myxococcales bacterium]